LSEFCGFYLDTPDPDRRQVISADAPFLDRASYALLGIGSLLSEIPTG